MTEPEKMLRCIECDHLGWNQTYQFEGVQHLYQLLQKRYNPACAQDDPRDQNMYQQNLQNQSNPQQTNQQIQPGMPMDTFYQSQYDVRETICPVYAETNRCNYIHGIANVYFPSYGGSMNIEMHVRSCIDAVAVIENGCYHMDTNLAYSDVRNYLEDKLRFLGNVELRRFIGSQCYCQSEMCYFISETSDLTTTTTAITTTTEPTMTEPEKMLRCIECDHLGWNQTYQFEGVQHLYQLLQKRYNPACAQDDPRDQNMYQQNLQNQSNPQQTNQQIQPGMPMDTFYQSQYDVRETICPVYAETNRCNYIHGIANVYFPSYGGSMNIEMHVRSCIDVVTVIEDGCYQRDTNLSYSDVRNYLEDKLRFLGNVVLRRFIGSQCYCQSDMCYIISETRPITSTTEPMTTDPENMLRCIECEHLGWNQTYQFEGVQHLYQLLQKRYNPACAQDDPRDQNMYQQNLQNQGNPQQTNQQIQPGMPMDTFYQSQYDVRETICPVYAETNRCNYIHGIANVYFPSYEGSMNIEMHVRSCIDAVAVIENGCYHRDTNLAYSDVRNYLQDKLRFLGSVELRRFIGRQCYCQSDMCYVISAARCVVATWLSLIFASVAIIFIK